MAKIAFTLAVIFLGLERLTGSTIELLFRWAWVLDAGGARCAPTIIVVDIRILADGTIGGLNGGTSLSLAVTRVTAASVRLVDPRFARVAGHVRPRRTSIGLARVILGASTRVFPNNQAFTIGTNRDCD